jgi:hypothetical protein
MRIVRVVFDDELEIGMGLCPQLDRFVNEPSAIMGMQVAGIVLQDVLEPKKCLTWLAPIAGSPATPAR